MGDGARLLPVVRWAAQGPTPWSNVYQTAAGLWMEDNPKEGAHAHDVEPVDATQVRTIDGLTIRYTEANSVLMTPSFWPRGPKALLRLPGPQARGQEDHRLKNP